MNLFNPRTFSTDWEIMVIDRLERWAGDEKLMAFASTLRSELGLPITTDWRTLECALGINTSFTQIWNRIELVTDRATQLLAEYDLDLFPAGAHPVEPMFNASHIHVGTIHDEGAGVLLENRLLQWTPVFGALAANSPVSHGRRGEFKSYRIQHRAHGCTMPGQMRDPRTSQTTWGGDAGVKVQGALTLEVRITDAASSRRLLAEMATFVAAWTHHCGTQQMEPLSPDEYRDYLSNRWLAARDGLQATFYWNGRPTPVVEIMGQMLDECAPALENLGARRTDFAIMQQMIEKRLCQADWVLDLAGRYPDDYTLASAHAKLARHWNVWEEYLAAAPALEPRPAPDERAIDTAHLELIGEGTHFHRSREAMYYPPPIADEIIERLVEQGTVRREESDLRGVTLSRVK